MIATWSGMGWIIYVIWIATVFWIDKNVVPFRSERGVVLVTVACVLEAMIVGRILNHKLPFKLFDYEDHGDITIHKAGGLRVEFSGLILAVVCIFVLVKDHF